MFLKGNIIFSLFLWAIANSLMAQNYEKANVKVQSLVIPTKSQNIRMQVDSNLMGTANGVKVYDIDTTYWVDYIICKEDLLKVTQLVSSVVNESISEYQISGGSNLQSGRRAFTMRIWGNEIPPTISDMIRRENISQIWIENLKYVDSNKSSVNLNILMRVTNQN